MIDKTKIYFRAIALVLIAGRNGGRVQINVQFLKKALVRYGTDLQINNSYAEFLLSSMEEAGVVQSADSRGERYINDKAVHHAFGGPSSNEAMRSIQNEIEELVRESISRGHDDYTVSDDPLYSWLQESLAEQQAKIRAEIDNVVNGAERRDQINRTVLQEPFRSKRQKSAQEVRRKSNQTSSSQPLERKKSWFGFSLEKKDVMIGSAIQKNGFISVYDEKGRYIAGVPISSGDVLQGYTSNTFSVRRGSMVTIFNARGRYISSSSI